MHRSYSALDTSVLDALANPRRRKLMKIAAAGGGLAALGLGSARNAYAADTITAATFPGAWETAHRSFLLPAYTKATGQQVNLVPALPLDILTKTAASRANPAFDVIVCDEGSFATAMSEDLIMPMQVDQMTNLKYLPPKFVDKTAMGAYVSAQVVGLAYITDRVKSPPVSWEELLKPEYKGRVGVVGFGSALGPVWLVEVAKSRGGDEEHMEPAFEYLRQLLPNIGAVASSPGQLATLMQQGQVDVAPHYSNNVGDLQSKGVPILMQRPATGWGIVRTTMHVVKNSKSPKLASDYINAALDAQVQALLADAPYYLAPTNVQVPYTKGFQVYASNAAELESFRNIDWVKLAPLREGYIDRFNREVKV
jgi:putative spermidine/putrescine transport system substrate-binding protein